MEKRTADHADLRGSGRRTSLARMGNDFAAENTEDAENAESD
jgi:hypothetical protein